MEAEILIADEAHRTAGLKATGKRDADQVKDFTVCHRNDAMPARNRVYMTATPRAFARGTGRDNKKYDLLSMDDEAIFGCELYRLSYTEAVTRKFLSDYRIIAVVPPESGRNLARKMALRTKSRVEGETLPKPRKAAKRNGKASTPRLTAGPARDTESLALRKLAYGMAIAGGVEEPDGNMRAIPLEHCVLQPHHAFGRPGGRPVASRREGLAPDRGSAPRRLGNRTLRAVAPGRGQRDAFPGSGAQPAAHIV